MILSLDFLFYYCIIFHSTVSPTQGTKSIKSIKSAKTGKSIRSETANFDEATFEVMSIPPEAKNHKKLGGIPMLWADER